MINKDLVDILICPKCKGDVVLSDDNKHIICTSCKLAYSITNDVPVMLIDSAVSTDDINKD